MFDNAKTVTINNKEVQSIKLSSNNAVLYEKPSLSLVTDKSTLSYHNQDSATLTATLTANGKGISGQTILFTDSSTTTYSNISGWKDFSVSLNGAFKLYFSALREAGLYIYIDSSNLRIIFTSYGVINLFSGGTSIATVNCSDTYIELKDGILSDGNGHSYDISAYDNNFTGIRLFGNCKAYFGCRGIAVTNNNGVATLTYDSVKAGNITITAKSGNYNLTSSVAIHDYDYYPNDILLTASPNIIQKGDVSDVTAIVSDSNGDAIGSGQLVQFYKE